ncbi:MAG: OmpH family outer membrane protein [Deltaproteobacteria bacterium]|nr:OmpH family outer membrane protein [Deltaproteobacteria bacterium]
MRNKVSTALLATALLAGLWCPAEGAQVAAGKIGVVDFQRCLNESKVGQKLKAEFSAHAQKAQAEFEKKETDLKQLREAIEKQGLVLSPAARVEKEKEYNDKRELFKEQFRATQQALQRQDQELTGRISRELQAIALKVGESEGYALILEKLESGVLFAGKEIDLTDEVIRRYDQEADQKAKAEAKK